jgi:Cu/Ag efflux protein CusF
MRTFFVVLLAALCVAVGMAFAVGLIAVAADHPDGRYMVTFTVDTDKIHTIGTESVAGQLPSKNAEDFVDVKGKVTTVRPDKNEVAVSENVNNWTFQLAKDGKVFLNENAAKLADLQAGDDATVSFERQGEQLIAHVVRCTRK